ncbi:MAG TPA: hypothetical protein VEH62_14070 [Gemmatimonadales bacterium]|nr:hypothetical protein [Gemmatimonadales bacterium]
MPPPFDRRQFLQATGATALYGAFGTRINAISGPRPAASPVRVAVLNEPGFPAVDGAAPAGDVRGALAGFDVTLLSADDLGAALAPDRFDVLVSPYGSAFPKAAWPALLAFLRGAGCWVNLGGVPGAVPVERADGGAWRALPREVTYHKQLGVVLACAVPAAAAVSWQANDALPWSSPLASGPAPSTVWEPYWRLSSVADTPDESGSAGVREAVVRPLVSGLDADGRPVVAPVVMVDRLEGEFAGGRWILVTGDAAPAADALRLLVAAAARGARRLEVRPSYACYRDGERPAVAVTTRAYPRGRPPAPLALTCRLEVTGPRGAGLGGVDVEVRGTEAEARGTADLDAVLPAAPEPGLYTIVATLILPGADVPELRETTGFWLRDERLLGAGLPLRAGADALARGGEPYPVTGTTYMASDVHRKFLFDPNPWLWDRDFAAMKRAGVNLVRTGIWTGWKRLMPRAGEPDEAALRALDAWILTARRHEMPVIFTLFAFLPETWGGENPYLDPAAVAAQRAFVSGLARRCAGMHDLAWDLINEPSFCNRDHLWSCRPSYDRFERAAWASWLAGRGLPAADLPPLADFAEGDAAVSHPTLVVEYRLFAQATFAGWVREMRAALAEAGAGRQLVTVGQDEAGTRDSPNNLFLAPELDFTCNHTWWLNDALAWDGVIAKAPGRANLIEETGVMFAAHPAGAEERWEAYARDLLERKLAMALGPAGAGFVEWVWNSNCYMPSDNEAAIGLLRADGTAKPELDVLRGVAAFAAAVRRHLVGREAERVLLVVPHANMFSTRNTATDATKRAVRAMVHGCRMGLGAISEYSASPSVRAPALVLVPAPRVLGAAAWDALAAWARRGSTVLVTGPLEPAERVFAAVPRPGDGPSGAMRVATGAGAMLWCPEPVELSADAAATAALYRWALAGARLAPSFTVEGDGADASTLVHAAAYRDAVLLTIVAEGSGARLMVRYGALPAVEAAVGAGRASLLLVDRRSGAVLASYGRVG